MENEQDFRGLAVTCSIVHSERSPRRVTNWDVRVPKGINYENGSRATDRVLLFDHTKKWQGDLNQSLFKVSTSSYLNEGVVTSLRYS